MTQTHEQALSESTLNPPVGTRKAQQEVNGRGTHIQTTHRWQNAKDEQAWCPHIQVKVKKQEAQTTTTNVTSKDEARLPGSLI